MDPRLTALAAGAAAFYGLYGFLTRLRRERVVADTPMMRIRSAAQGYVKVTGKTLPAGPAATTAPLSARPCVWWDYAIAREERDARGNVRWHTVERAASVELFALADDDGARCLVGPVSAEVTPTVSNTWYGSEPRPVGPPPDPAPLPLLHSGPWRYTERLLGVGERVCVMGELRSHSGLGDVSAAVAAKLHEWKEDGRSLLARFDADHDGRLDAVEWEAARTAAAQEVQAQALEKPIERVSIITQPMSGEPFLIAPRTAAQLEKGEQRFAVLHFVLGLLGTVVCAWALHQLR